MREAPAIERSLESLVTHWVSMVPLAPARQRAETGTTRTYGAGVLDAAPDGMFIVDAQGRILLANRQAHSVFGYAPSELVGQPVEVLLPDALRAAAPGSTSSHATRTGPSFPSRSA